MMMVSSARQLLAVVRGALGGAGPYRSYGIKSCGDCININVNFAAFCQTQASVINLNMATAVLKT